MSSFVNYKKGCTRLAAASDKAYQLLAYGRWFSPCTPASSTTKTGRHDIAEILLKVALKHQKSKSIHTFVHFSDNHQKLSTINEVEIEGKSDVTYERNTLLIVHFHKNIDTQLWI